MAEKKTEEKLGKTGLSQIEKALETIPENKKIFAEKLYKRIKFMDKTLDDLQKKIKKEGPIIEAKNGNGFTVLTENPAQKSYTSMMGKYNTSVKNLLDLIPNDVGVDDELMSFIKGKSK